MAQVEGAEVIHFKGKINDTINPCPATAEEDRAEFIPAAGYPEPAAHTHMTSVNMHKHTQTEAHAAVVHTDTLWGHLVCQLSIWAKVVIELKAVACIFVAGSYLMEVIGLILQAAETERERPRGRDSMTDLVN